jgi:signal peptide peptidase SppA
MTLTDLLYGPWALRLDVLTEMQRVYELHAEGVAVDVKALEARLGNSPLNSSQSAGDYEVRNGVAVLPITGVLAPKANLMTMICGGTSMQMALATLQTAMADRKVQSILSYVDSPGGNVIGPPEYAQALYEASKVKPVVTLCDGTMASAGMWVGAAANQVFVTSSTAMVGNVGVVGRHVDKSAANKASGVVETEITAGKYKRIASANAPLSKEGRAYLQAQVDYIYGVFVDALAMFRGVSAQTVLDHMAEGRDFVGQQAIDAGLVDGIMGMDALVADMSSNPSRYAKRSKAKPKAVAMSAPPDGGTAPDNNSSQASASDGALFSSTSNFDEETAMSANAPTATATPITREAFERDQPALFAALQQEFTAAGVATGAAAERERIQAVRALALPGHEALVEQLAFDGKTMPGEAAIAVTQAQRTALAAQARAHFADAPPAAATSAVDATGTGAKDKNAQVLEAKAYAAEHSVDFVTAMKKLGFAS